MTPCTVQAKHRAVKLIGFPLMANLQSDVLTDKTCYENAARFIANTTFEELPSNPLSVIKKMTDLLADDDGDLKANFREKNFHIDEVMQEYQDEHADADPVSEENQPAKAKEENILNFLYSRNHDLQETRIDHGSEVTVFGTYVAAKQAVNIGSGLKNLQHSIQPGKIDAVIGKNFTKAIIATVIFAAISGFAHYYVAKLIGLI